MLKMRTAFLCRTNAPLVKCAFDLIKRKIKVKIIGRDVASILKETIGEIIEARRNPTVQEFLELMDNWLKAIREKYGDDEKNVKKITDAEDRYGCLAVMAERCKYAMEIYRIIDSFFIDSEDETDPNAVILCSGHRSKGLEFERVFIIRDDLMPHPNAKSEEDLRQEENIRYVTYTRAMHEMYVVNDMLPA